MSTNTYFAGWVVFIVLLIAFVCDLRWYLLFMLVVNMIACFMGWCSCFGFCFVFDVAYLVLVFGVLCVALVVFSGLDFIVVDYCFAIGDG